jgi:hypothetical protein
MPGFAALLIASSTLVISQAQQPSIPERVAALKAALGASQTNLRQYEWIETTVVTLKGDEKSRKQQRCYYGADGALQKVEISASPPPEQKPGLRGRVIASKRAELSDYMQSAVSLVKLYLPPDPARIQAVKDAGKVSIEVLQPGQRIRLNFPNYLKPGDNLGVEFDLVNNRPVAITVSTYLADPTDAVLLNAQVGSLNDGSIYASDTTLSASAKQLQVAVQNSGYRKQT